ncbi:MAG: class I SAM-dependent methyltransferase [Bradymonadaceae bacterium]
MSTRIAVPWSLALAERCPAVKVTGLDHPEVIEHLLQRARELGLQDRVEALGGDMFTVALEPGSFDLVMIGQVLRIVPPEQARALVHRMAETLEPGGAMVVIDAFADDDDDSRRRHAVYALHLAIRSPGEVHSEDTVRAWMEEAGLSEFRRLSLGLASHINAL